MTGTQLPRTIRGVVLSAEHRRVKGAVVSVTSAPVPVPDIAALTDERGEFALTAPVSGRYVITVSYPGGPAESRAVDVTDEPAGVEVEVTPSA